MMKRFFTLLLAVLILLGMTGILFSCAEQTPNEPASADSGAGEPSTGPAPEPESETEEPAMQKYETEYVPPDDHSFTICGVPLEEYTFVLYFPKMDDRLRELRFGITDHIEQTVLAATGLEIKVKVAKNEKQFTEPKYEHEILFGQGFVREGKPERESMCSYYGVTENGVVYFSSPSDALYSYLWDLFLGEFLGVPEGSGAASEGCAVSPFLREIPRMDKDRLKVAGYSVVFEDDFEGDALNTDNWLMVPLTVHWTTYPGNVSVRDGILSLRGTWVDEPDYPANFYGADLGISRLFLYGYFEASIKCSYIEGRGPRDFWSAFWIQAPDAGTPEQSQGGIGPGGAELDIMENFGPDFTSCCFWCSGVEGIDGLASELYEFHDLGYNYHEEYHNYSLLWDESCYSVYLDGYLICRTSYFYGTSSVPEDVRLTINPRFNPDFDHDDTREMFVDYVRIWQKAEN